MKRFHIMLAVTAAMILAFTAGCKKNTNDAESASDASSDSAASVAASVVSLEVAAAADNAPEYTERDLDGTYDASDAVTVDLSALTDGYTITEAGIYVFSGTLSDGQILVNAGEDDKVQIVLSGASVTNADGPAIYVVCADKVFVTAAEGTENALSDGASYAADSFGNTPDGCIFSKCDLTVNGTGVLTINGNYKFGIVGKDDVVLADVTLTVTAKSDGVCGKDSVAVNSGTIQITAGGDGIVSENTDDAEKGVVQIDGGTITIVTGGASADSAKGIKASCAVYLNGGDLTIDAEDDAVHSGGTLSVTGGVLTAASGDDGLHADDTATFSGGTVTVTESYEGIEAGGIAIAGGTITITASDDGLNAAGGSDSSADNGPRGGDNFATDADRWIVISGGTLTIRASGDGIDSNGSLSVTGGVTLISGPENSANGALDSGTDAVISGGVVIAAGSTGMAETFSSESTQCSLLYTYGSVQSAGTLLTLTAEDGTVLASYAPTATYQSVVISTPEMTQGDVYTLFSGGSVSGGVLSGGTTIASVTLSGVSTTVGSGGSFGTNDFGTGDRGGQSVPGDQSVPDGQSVPGGQSGPGGQDFGGGNRR